MSQNKTNEFFTSEFFRLYNLHSKNALYNEDWLNDMCDELVKIKDKEIAELKSEIEERNHIIRTLND